MIVFSLNCSFIRCNSSQYQFESGPAFFFLRRGGNARKEPTIEQAKQAFKRSAWATTPSTRYCGTSTWVKENMSKNGLNRKRVDEETKFLRLPQEFPVLTKWMLDMTSDAAAVDAQEIDARQFALFTPCTCIPAGNWIWPRPSPSGTSWPPSRTTSSTSNSTRNGSRVSCKRIRWIRPSRCPKPPSSARLQVLETSGRFLLLGKTCLHFAELLAAIFDLLIKNKNRKLALNVCDGRIRSGWKC